MVESSVMWYVVKCRKPLECALTIREKLGLDVYAPFTKMEMKPTRYQRGRGQRGSLKERPALGKYIFVRSHNITIDIYEISRVRGVLGVLGCSDLVKPYPVSQVDIDRMRRRFKNWHRSTGLSVGDLIDYCGYRVPILEMDGASVTFMAKAFGREFLQTVDARELENAHAA